MLRTSALICAACFGLACEREPVETPAAASEEPRVAAPDNNRVGAAPDNSRVNERDRSGDTQTPLDQGNGAHDLRITQEIRKAIVDNSDLSFTAKNIKVITEAGHVTLRGPVNTAAERDVIAKIATSVAGVSHVENQLELETNKQGEAQ